MAYTDTKKISYDGGCPSLNNISGGCTVCQSLLSCPGRARGIWFSGGFTNSLSERDKVKSGLYSRPDYAQSAGSRQDSMGL